jgi:hypothetical protein
VTRAWILLPAVLLGAAAAAAQAPQRETRVEVYGDDPCPPSSDDEIVVCARRPEEDRYRIPAELRQSDRRPEGSWTSSVEELEEAQRDTRPGSCSVVGSWGQSGCWMQMIRQWWVERRARGSR